MSATAPQPAARPVPKVLRIGIVQGGKIVQERVFRIGETVTIGESPKNTFVLTGTKLPQRHEIFVVKGDSYLLSVPDWIEGKISWKDGIRDLEELRVRGEAQKKGDVYQVPLNENVRGKVTIGPSTLLFQFVPAPPEPIRQVSPSDFRARIFDDDDPLFHGLLGVFTVIAASFVLWVATTPLPERLDLDAVAAARDLVVVDKVEKIVIEMDALDDKPADEKKPDEKKPDEKAESKPTEPAKATVDSVKKQSLLLQQIGTAGDTSNSNAVNDILGDDAAAMAGLDKALTGVNGVESASATSVGVKAGSKDGRGDATVGIAAAGGGNASTSSGSVRVKKPKVETGSADADVESGDGSSIGSVVKKSGGRIQSCVEQSLKSNQDLNGRVSVGWTIQAGRVSEAHLVKNSTGDDAVAKCIVNAVRSFRFDPGLTAEVSEFPWVVSGQ